MALLHDELRELVGLYVLGALTPAESAILEAHLADCAECAAEVRALAPSTQLLAASVPYAEPSPQVRQRVLSSIGAQKVSRRGSIAPWLAVAASLALASALGLYSAELRNRVQSLELRLRDAILRADAGDRLTADARQAVRDSERRVAVLTSPDVARIELKGQPAAPQASARAFWSRSSGLVFAASDLPPSPQGRTYQLWILTAQTAPISDGWLLKPDAAGRVTAIFNTPPSLPMPVAMAVTLEPDGGMPAPTGAKFLVGAPN